jgi:hypothetical protein
MNNNIRCRVNLFLLKSFLLLLFISFADTDLFSQDFTKDFKFTFPHDRIPHSLYNKIDILDLREDTASIGIVDAGVLNNFDAALVFKPQVATQLTDLFDSLIDMAANNGELLFMLKQFGFKETRGGRYCYVRAGLFSKINIAYEEISTLDTVIVLKSSWEKAELVKKGSKIITDFISKGILSPPADHISYSFNDLTNIDSIKKAKIPLYNAVKYKDGVYFSYRSFMNQTPDFPGFVRMNRNNNVSSVKVPDSTGEKVKLDPEDMYAVIYNGRLFIATEFGYYQLQKIGDDFYFTGKIRIAGNRGNLGATELGFGLLGQAVSSINKIETYNMKIDYINGRFIHMQKVVDTDSDPDFFIH